MKKYDYDRERPWISKIIDMQLDINKSTKMCLERLERIVKDLADAVFSEEDNDIINKLEELSGSDRFKL